MDPARQAVTYLYVFGAEVGPSKVGQSTCPPRRLKQLQAKHPERIVVAGTWPVGGRVALATERYVHWLLRERHVHGEWFDAPREEIVAAIETALRVGPDPEYPMPRADMLARGIGSGEHLSVKHPKGTKARIDDLLAADEHRADFIREAVEREITRRSKAK